jgi:hypothetical protein
MKKPSNDSPIPTTIAQHIDIVTETVERRAGTSTGVSGVKDRGRELRARKNKHPFGDGFTKNNNKKRSR